MNTGAAHTIIAPDTVSNIGIKAELSDNFITMYGIIEKLKLKSQ